MKGGNNIADAIYNFDLFLHQKEYGRKFEAVIIGGAALVLMGITNRETQDVDFLDPIIPIEFKNLAYQFALENPHYHLIPNTWINNGPISLICDLTDGWRERLLVVFNGKILTLYTLGRIDLIKSKIYACADRDKHDFDDCLKLCPSLDELNQCKTMVLDKDGKEFWPVEIENVWNKLKKALDHE